MLGYVNYYRNYIIEIIIETCKVQSSGVTAWKQELKVLVVGGIGQGQCPGFISLLVGGD